MIDFKKLALCHMADDELPGVDMYLVKITPALAKEMLADNALGQRTPSASTIDRYHADIRMGAWKFAGDPIRYSILGRVIDGQHRLASIASGNVDVINMVITGLDPDVMPAIDTGRKRSLSNLLQIENPAIRYPKTIQSTLARLWYWDVAGCYYIKGLPRHAVPTELNSAQPSFSQLLDLMHKWQAKVGTTFEQAAIMGHQAFNKTGTITPAAFATLYIQLSAYDKDVRENIFNQFIHEPASTSAGHPINALRARLRRLSQSANESWNAQLQQHFVTIIANNLLAGTEVNILRTPSSISFPYLAELKWDANARDNLSIDVIPSEPQGANGGAVNAELIPEAA